jgi:hypothetical protein
MTAIGLLCRILIEKKADDPLHAKQADRIAADPPVWALADKDRPVDFYYWYYGTLALHQLDGPARPRWKKWNEAMTTALVASQAVKKDGCRDGSWDPAVDRWGFAGGRVYATAMNVLTLEVYYRYERVLGKR